MDPQILIIDDSDREREDIQDFLVERITSKKMRMPNFVQATNGREAFQILESGLRPELILLDYHMPEMNGIELIDEIDSKLGLKTPIIVFSSYGETRKEVEKRGRLFYLKGRWDEIEGFYNEAVHSYSEAVKAYSWQLDVKEKYEKNKKGCTISVRDQELPS